MLYQEQKKYKFGKTESTGILLLFLAVCAVGTVVIYLFTQNKYIMDMSQSGNLTNSENKKCDNCQLTLMQTNKQVSDCEIIKNTDITKTDITNNLEQDLEQKVTHDTSIQDISDKNNTGVKTNNSERQINQKNKIKIKNNLNTQGFNSAYLEDVLLKPENKLENLLGFLSIIEYSDNFTDIENTPNKMTFSDGEIKIIVDANEKFDLTKKNNSSHN